MVAWVLFNYYFYRSHGYVPRPIPCNLLGWKNSGAVNVGIRGFLGKFIGTCFGARVCVCVCVCVCVFVRARWPSHSKVRHGRKRACFVMMHGVINGRSALISFVKGRKEIPLLLLQSLRIELLNEVFMLLFSFLEGLLCSLFHLFDKIDNFFSYGMIYCSVLKHLILLP